MDSKDISSQPGIESVENAAPAKTEKKSGVPTEQFEIQTSESRPHRVSHHHDAAGDLLRKAAEAEGGRIEMTPADNARVLRKIDLVILPIILAVYFLQALDKTTLSYASVFGLQTDTNLHGTQYSWLGSIVYLAQLVAQPAVAWMLVKLPTGKFISTAVLLWGATLACMTAAHNFQGLMASRFFLGLFEASVAPCFVAVTQMWWRRREQTSRVSFWYAMNGFTNMFGSLITYGLGHISTSTLHSYQIIFLFFGLITVAFSFVMYVYMPDSPMKARFLNDHDKLIALERLRMNQQGVMSGEWRWDHAREAMLDPKTWLWFSLIIAISIPSGGITTFGPLIVSSFGFDSFQTILFNIPFGFIQTVATVGGAWLATRLRKKGPVIALLCMPAIAGAAILKAIPHSSAHKVPLLVGYYIVSVYPGISPLIYAWSAQNTAGDTKRKCTTAVLFIGQSVGNIIGPQLYTTAEEPEYSRGLQSNLALFVVVAALSIITMAYIIFLNRSHSRRRVAAGKSAIVIDVSLHTAEEADRIMRERENDEDAAAPTGDNAFEDMTDLENDEFVFVL